MASQTTVTDGTTTTILGRSAPPVRWQRTNDSSPLRHVGTYTPLFHSTGIVTDGDLNGGGLPDALFDDNPCDSTDEGVVVFGAPTVPTFASSDLVGEATGDHIDDVLLVTGPTYTLLAGSHSGLVATPVWTYP